jgi:hypothetical protein
VHLLTEPDAPRERRSVESVSALDELGVEYVPRVNAAFTGIPPRATCARPTAVTAEFTYFPNEWQLGPGHYGCYQAHRDAVRRDFDPALDLLVVCECDCILQESAAAFVETLYAVDEFLDRNGVAYLSLGNGWHGPSSEEFALLGAVFRTHCIAFPKSTRHILLDAFATRPWDAIDYWYNETFAAERIAIACRPRARQAAGVSLLERVAKDGV